MTSTPRLDSLAADGTSGVYEGIHLADGHMLTVTIRPGADWADSVYLHPGLTAPDTEAWEDADSMESWLTGGPSETTYEGVPVEAVRELIVAHGGEHEDQEPPASAIEGQTGAEAAPDLLSRIAETTRLRRCTAGAMLRDRPARRRRKAKRTTAEKPGTEPAQEDRAARTDRSAADPMAGQDTLF
ncbi:hypothetical protein ACWGS5_13700 [Streptomyces albidoflavus]|uniref:hypothetical protein n=1 Tax=Streptomyces sp. WAC00276 TaxID=2933778 RepID=UPI001FFF4227|nr:hypothetical protein [Streptomyces sp. WAC00276]MCK2145328.1 hypothetical protein [Streptomyces sp. WAC00276]